MALSGLDPLKKDRLRLGVMSMYIYEPYHPCPVCRDRLKFLRNQREHGTEWEVYHCTEGCKSEVWIDPYKGQRKGFWFHW